jgi:ankyrin repeat protein
VLLVGCGTTQTQKTVEPSSVKVEVPDIPIHEAVLFGNIEAVKQHLAAGTDVNAKGDHLGFEDIEWTPLRGAAYRGDKEIVELLIAEGADVNAKADGGRTPLHGAAYWGRKEIAELLIAKGADVNVKIEVGELKGQTPLDAATHPDNPNASAETADLLRKHGGKTGEELKAEGIDNTDHQYKTE